MAERMRVGIGLPSDPTDEQLTLAKQMGCEDVVLSTPTQLPGEEWWEWEDLARLRERVESFGLRLASIQVNRADWTNKIKLGLPGRERQLENYQRTVRSIGKAGIPILTYNFKPDRTYRTDHVPGRGGALVSAFDRAKIRDLPPLAGRAIPADEMWANYELFAKAVMPVAEEAGVRMALHPDDPPGDVIAGVARLFSSFEGFVRAAEIANSPAFGLLFCVGCWSEMGGYANVRRGIEHFGPKGQIVYVHFREVIGEGDRFRECILGEGQIDLTGVAKALRDNGFDGFVMDDHAAEMAGDPNPWHPRTRLYQTGYLMGMVRALDDLSG